jgi:hypothetical protein
MQKFKNHFIVALALGVLIGSLVLGGALAGHAAPDLPPQNVNVVNTTSNPVPTQAVGTTSVAGNVSVVNQPTVKIGNNAATPVLVRDLDNPARHPFQFYATFSKTGGNFLTDNQIAVPAGKRLVIETVTVQAYVPAGQKLLAQINMVGGGTFAQHNILLTPQGGFDFNLLDYFAATESVRLYADQGSAVPFSLTRSSSDANLWGGSYTVSGYLIDVQ